MLQTIEYRQIIWIESYRSAEPSAELVASVVERLEQGKVPFTEPLQVLKIANRNEYVALSGHKRREALRQACDNLGLLPSGISIPVNIDNVEN